MNKEEGSKVVEHAQSDLFGFSSACRGGKQGQTEKADAFYEALVSHLRCSNREVTVSNLQ